MPVARVYKGGVGLEFFEKVDLLKIDALVVLFGIYGVDFPRRVYKSGIGLEFFEKVNILKIDTIVVIFGIYGVDFSP